MFSNCEINSFELYEPRIISNYRKPNSVWYKENGNMIKYNIVLIADRIQNKADVHVVDISKGGIAFKSGYDFKVNSFYDTVITLANGEKLYVVVEILHRDSCENDEYMYGCRFVGIGAEDQFKIEAYQIVDTGSAI